MDKIEKEIISKSLLESVAKVLVFYKNNENVILKSAIFDKGVYRINLMASNLNNVIKRYDIVDDHIICKELVEDILLKNSYCRDNDMTLILKVWESQGIKIKLDDESLNIMFSPESITRARRKIQNTEGKFLPTSLFVANKRRINKELLREHYKEG